MNFLARSLSKPPNPLTAIYWNHLIPVSPKENSRLKDRDTYPTLSHRTETQPPRNLERLSWLLKTWHILQFYQGCLMLGTTEELPTKVKLLWINTWWITYGELQFHALQHLFNKYLLCFYAVPSTIIGTGNWCWRRRCLWL